MDRRLTTVVAADIAGFSRLVGIDEEATIAAQKGHRQEVVDPLLSAYGGRVANTAGDSLLIEFPSPVQAVRCALEVQKGLAKRNRGVADDRKIQYRIGINVGDVIQDGADLLGDGVNVAARLEALAPPGGIVLSRSAYDHVRGQLLLSLEDLGHLDLKNIAHPVRAFRILSESEKRPAARIPGTRFFAVFAGVLLASLLLLAFLFIEDVFKGSSAIVDPRRPVLIVLPFNNLSGDPAQDYFSDAFTEDITTALARTPGLLVVARNTAFTFKGKAIDARQIGRELGVRYMLEGSARQFNGVVRVNAQLIETSSGTHVWAESFDRPLEDIFIVQDKLTDRIVGSVASHLRRHEGERVLAAKPETLAAYDLTARASLLFRNNTPDDVREARTLLRRAITIDPSYAKAYTVLARVENFFFTSRISTEYAAPETAERVIKAASQAVAIAPDDAYAHAVYGMALRMRKDYQRASEQAQIAQNLAPNDPDVLSEVASVLIGAGDYNGVVETIELARSLDPYLSPVFIGAHLSQAYFALGDFPAAKRSAEVCLERSPQDVRCVESLVRALGETGPHRDAQAAVSRLLELSPDFTVTDYIRRASRNRSDQAAIDRWAEGLRKAGVPEG
ncbi:adenylate/guanylate cyclase domain-containing protein [Leisingera sp. JC1]|uniref:adenylate/guanylate cyclase domain-containing protein n=1 Tax=Leisingera sp. JC1 TaxID=1855282 RepID=UPI00080323CD|nr:adenylate/guanylate cyclase domain-containing protein [Leisingera sp. JC1]OBY25284.1 hypothetical protein A9D60_22295 [Leisingera sp. JC1]